MYRFNNHRTGFSLIAGLQLIFAAIYFAFAGWSCGLLLEFFLKKDIHWLGDVIIGIVAGAITIPVAIVFGAVGQHI